MHFPLSFQLFQQQFITKSRSLEDEKIFSISIKYFPSRTFECVINTQKVGLSPLFQGKSLKNDFGKFFGFYSKSMNISGISIKSSGNFIRKFKNNH